MREYQSAVFSHTSEQNFIIYFDEKDIYSIRATVYKGRPYLSIVDVARCIGLTAPSKLAQRYPCEKVKIDTKTQGARKVGMWYFSLENAEKFVKEHDTMPNNFRDWFCQYLIPEIRGKDLSFVSPPSSRTHTPPVQAQTRNPVAQPIKGVNISPELIDRIIVELLTLKQGMTSA